MTTLAERRNVLPTATPRAGPTALRADLRHRESGDALETTERLLGQLDRLPPGHPDRLGLRTRAIEKNLPLATKLACRYARRGEPLEDLKQVAALALVRAVDGYDPNRQVPFVGYAVPSILGAIKRHFRDTTWGVRVPRWIQELDREAAAAAEELGQRWGRRPTNPELADHLRVSLDDLLAAVSARQAYRLVSLNTPAAETDTSDRPDLINHIGSIDSGYACVEAHVTLRPLLATLPQRERRILILRYYYQMTQARIAVEVGLSQMHVSRLLRQSLTRLQTATPP
jgi:RNA polymerase sigma-B factor